MCGIVGATAKRPVSDILLAGLHSLEYRGYDSAGVALLHNDALFVSKHQGKVAILEAALLEHPSSSHTGIAHTRWATHGVPSAENAHPHVSNNRARHKMRFL